MPSYMTVVVLALAASNASTALSLPVHFSREIQEQNLSRRQGPDPETQAGGHAEAPPLQAGGHAGAPPLQAGGYAGAPPLQAGGHAGAPAWGTPIQAGAPPPDAAAPGKGTPPVKPPKNVAVPKGGSNWRSMGLSFALGTTATMLGVYLLNQMGRTVTVPGTSSANQDTQYQNTQYQNPQYQNPHYQQRAVDHDKRADIFEPSETKPRSISHLDLLSRHDADLGEALKLFKRVLDELD